MNNSIISAQSLTKSFRDCTALNNVTFSIDKPCIVGLIGNNGAGKTTLLKILNGIYNPTSGKATVLEANATDIASRENSVLIDDTIAYPFHYKLKNILNEMPNNYKNWDGDKAEKLMQHFALPHDRAYTKLSKGMKSIFNTIVALSANAPITLLDEPTSGMDVGARKDFYSIVLNEFIANPRLIMISSHLVGEMENILSHAVILKNNKLLFSGETSKLTSLGLLLQGNAEDIAPLIEKAKVLDETDIFGKKQYSILSKFTEEDYEYMTKHGIEHQQLSLNDICVYLCSTQKNSIKDIYQ